MVTGVCGHLGAPVPRNVTRENTHEPDSATIQHRVTVARLVLEQVARSPLALIEDVMPVRTTIIVTIFIKFVSY